MLQRNVKRALITQVLWEVNFNRGLKKNDKDKLDLTFSVIQNFFHSYFHYAKLRCVGKNPSLSFHQIPSSKRKEIRQEWLCHRIKRGQNEKYLPKDSTLYICSEHFEKDCCGGSASKFYQHLKRICKNIHQNKPC